MSDSPNILLRVHYYPLDSKKREFYSSKRTNSDYIGYMDFGHKAGKHSDYMDYQGNEEKSFGVFDSFGLLDEKRKSQYRKELQKCKSNIWDIIISTKEEFGKEKLKSYLNALDLLNDELPKFLNDNHLSIKKVGWCGALHENTDNRHIHLLMYEKEMNCFNPDTKEKRYHSGIFSKLSMEDFKVRIEQNLLGHEHSYHLYRDKILLLEKEKLKDEKTVYSKDLKEMLLNLYRIAPKGKYGYENKKADSIRPEIDKITTFMLSNDDSSLSLFLSLMRNLKKKDEETKKICERNKIDPKRYLISESFKDDLYRRCGNLILAHIRDSKNMLSDFYKGTNEDKERWNEKKRRGYLLSKAIHLDTLVSNERISLFDEYQRRLEKAEYQRLVEEGVIEAS